MIVIAGPNGSGKTSVTQKFLLHEWAEGTLYINPDEIAQELFGDWNSNDAVLKAANYCAELRDKYLQEHKSFVFETVMSAEDKVDFILRAKRAGFFIRIFFISTSHPSINAARIANRVMKGGHDVPICRTITPAVDRLYVYDNSVDGEDARLLFRLSEGQLKKMYVADVPEWAQILLPE